MNVKIFALFIVTLISHPVYSQWSTTPDSNLQISTWSINPILCSDKTGGAYIAWSNFHYYKTRYYIQHIDKNGYTKWASPKLLVNTGDMQDYYASMIEDGLGGAIIALNVRTAIDTAEGKILYTGKIILQRIDSLGLLLWGETGLRASLDSNDQNAFEAPQIISNKNNGAIIAWRSKNTITSNLTYNYTIQKVSLNGERMWGETGIRLIDTLANTNRGIVEDGDGGVIAQYGVSLNYITFQRINSNGVTVWKTFSQHSYVNMVSDKNNGLWLAGLKYVTGLYSLVINRIHSNGDFYWIDDRIISDSLTVVSKVTKSVVQSDTSLLVYWRKNTSSMNISQSYLQIVNSLGDIIYPGDGIMPAKTEANDRIPTGMCVSNNNSVITLFIDNRNGFRENYAQKIDGKGNLLWGEGGILFSKYKQNDELIGYAKIIENGNGGIIAVSSIEPAWGVFAHQLNKDGKLGYYLSGVKNDFSVLPFTCGISQNFPNPFNPITSIIFTVNIKSDIKIEIYNIIGQKIKLIVNSAFDKGQYECSFDGSKYPSGVYVYRMIVNGQSMFSKKMMLNK